MKKRKKRKYENMESERKKGIKASERSENLSSNVPLVTEEKERAGGVKVRMRIAGKVKEPSNKFKKNEGTIESDYQCEEKRQLVSGL